MIIKKLLLVIIKIKKEKKINSKLQKNEEI